MQPTARLLSFLRRTCQDTGRRLSQPIPNSDAQEVRTRYGRSGASQRTCYAPGNDKVLALIDNVLKELTQLFQSKYIHLGGDECHKVRWKDCPKCQARIKAPHLEAKDGHSAEERLQSYVITHASNYLKSLGRNTIAWDEILEGGLAEGATVMSWRGEAGGMAAAKQNHDVVMTPNSYLYFD
jgi:N-acetyl-beta-hexosaminidase